jgi:hypothetical protein
LCVYVCSISKKKCSIYYSFSFLKKVIYLDLNYVILVFSRLERLFQVYNDVSNQI